MCVVERFGCIVNYVQYSFSTSSDLMWLHSYVSIISPQVVYEVPSTSQWCFDVQWCPRHPGLISTASFDGHICVYSLLGGRGSEDSGAKVRRSGYHVYCTILEHTLKCKEPC